MMISHGKLGTSKLIDGILQKLVNYVTAWKFDKFHSLWGWNCVPQTEQAIIPNQRSYKKKI